MTDRQFHHLLASILLAISLFLFCDGYIHTTVKTEVCAGDSVWHFAEQRGRYSDDNAYDLVTTSGEAINTGDVVEMQPGDTFLLRKSWILHKDLSIDYHDFEFQHGKLVHRPVSVLVGGTTMAVLCCLFILVALSNLGKSPLIKNENVNERLLFFSLLIALVVGLFYVLR